MPLRDVVIVGDTGGYVRAFNKVTGQPVTYGGYPLLLSSEPYRSGDQGERWWEPIGGTATQMTVAAGMMIVGVNSTTEDRTVLKAYKLHPLLDLSLAYLSVPNTASPDGFNIGVRAVCTGCDGAITTTVSLKLGGYQLPRKAVTFNAGNGYAVDLTWNSGPVSEGTITVIATVDPDNQVEEADETNNSLRATVVVQPPPDDQNDDGWGSDLTK